MSIMEYNGGVVMAMCGDGCVGICADRRLGVRQLQTVALNQQKIFPMHEKCMVGLSGLATDVMTVSAAMKLRHNLFALREDRPMPTPLMMNMISAQLYEKRFGPWFVNPCVAGLDQDNKPMICSYDLIGAISASESFVCSGSAEDQLLGVCESFWRPGMNADELFETMAQCLLAACDRDCLAGWGGVVHIMTPEGITTKYLKGRMD
jgi:20S proteasome subunit beta 3